MRVRLKFAQLVRTKSQLSLARCTPPSIQARFERLYLRGLEHSTLPRHIPMQQYVGSRVQAYIHIGPYMVELSDAPDQLLLETGIAAVAVATVRSVRRRFCELPHGMRAATR